MPWSGGKASAGVEVWGSFVYCGCIDRAVRDGVHRGVSQSVADLDRPQHHRRSRRRAARRVAQRAVRPRLPHRPCPPSDNAAVRAAVDAHADADPPYDPTASSTLRSKGPCPAERYEWRWTGLVDRDPGGHSPAVPASTTVTWQVQQGLPRVHVERPQAHATPWLSADGLTWKAGTSFTSAFGRLFKDMIQKWSDHDECRWCSDNSNRSGSLLLVDQSYVRWKVWL